jgi:hypothetical protein
MCHTPVTSSRKTLPPQELVLLPPSTVWSPAPREAGSRERVEQPKRAPGVVCHAGSHEQLALAQTPLNAQSKSVAHAAATAIA